MRRLAWMTAAGCFVLVLLLLALPTGALAGSSTTILVHRFTVPISNPWCVDTDGRYVIAYGYNCELTCYDLRTHKVVAIPGMSGDNVEMGAAIADGTCVWIPFGNIPLGIDGYGISTRRSFSLSAGSPQATVETPVIDGGIVAWTLDGYGPLEAYNVATKTRFTICPKGNVTRSVTGIAKGLVVWLETPLVTDPGEIKGYLVKTKKSIVICADPADHDDPVTDGRTVAWRDWRDGDYADVWAYDTLTKRTYRMSGAARLSGTTLDADAGAFVWGDLRDDATSVRGYYVPSRTAFVIRPEAGITLIGGPRIAKNLVVWDEQLGDVRTLRGARLHEWVCSVSAPAHTWSRTVTVLVTSKGSAAKVTHMRFSVNGGHWTAWRAFSRTRPLALSGAAGAKRIRVELRDASGHLSLPATATVHLL